MASPRKSTPKSASTAAVPIETDPISVAESPSLTTDEPGREIPESTHVAAERSLESTRSAYDHFRSVTEKASGSFEMSYMAAAKGLQEFNAKAIDALKNNADATFELMKALMNVTTVSAAITLQTEHARKQFEALSRQTKELTEIATKVAAETTEPLKTSVAEATGKAA
jgi:phasin